MDQLSRKTLINVICITSKGNIFLEAIDTSLKIKYANYIAKVIERSIDKLGGVYNVVVIVSNNVANYKHVAKIICIKYPKITWVPCATHSIINLLLKDIGKLSFINSKLLEFSHIVKFIKENQYSSCLFRMHSSKVLHIFCEIWFPKIYLVLTKKLYMKSYN